MTFRKHLPKLWLIHPWLMAAAPVAFLLAHNEARVDADIVLLSLGVSLAGATVLFALAWLLLRRAEKAAALTTLATALFFTYGHWFNILVARNLIASHRLIHTLVSIVFAIVFVGAATWIVRERRSFQPVNQFLTCLLAIGLAFWVYGTVRGHRVVFHRKRLNYTQAATTRPAPLARDDAAHPDVYHLILDGYARQDVLARHYGHDNAPFLRALRERGFYVADQSVCNYPMTFMSLASTLNMRYLTEEIDRHRKGGLTSKSYFLDLIRDHEVGRTFQALGYRHVHFGTTFLATEDAGNADIAYSFTHPLLHREFSTVLLRTTMLRGLEPSVVDLHRFTFRKLREIPSIQGPTYTFAHLLLPHMPFVFDRQGRQRSNVPLGLQFVDVTGGWGAKAEYVDQLVYTNAEVLRLVDDLLRDSPHPPLIVIHSDHGTASQHPGTRTDLSINPERWDELIRERTGVLQALYVPASQRKALYPTMTPVNTFRFVFRECFGLDYPRLKDRSYFAWYDRPYHIKEVTRQVLTPAGTTKEDGQ